MSMADASKLSDLVAALDCRDLFSNPAILRLSADEIDCAGSCDHCWSEHDTNASGCHKSEEGEHCPNDVAETLRALADFAESFWSKEVYLCSDVNCPYFGGRRASSCRCANDPTA